MKVTSLIPRAFALFLGTALALAAQPQTPDLQSLAERLQKLESQVDTLRKENQGLRQQLGYDAKGKPTAAAVVAMGKEAKLAIGGYMHLNGEFGDAADSRFPANDRFLLRKIRLGVKGSFAEDIDFSMQADLGNNSLNSTSAYRLQAADVVVVWKKYSAATVTVGQFKTPYGYEQILSDVKVISIERSLANDQLTLGRQAGAMVAGAFFDKKLTYAVAGTNGLGANVSSNDNEQFTYSGHIAGTAFDNKKVKVALGASAFSSRDTGTFTGRRTGQGVDAQVTFAGAEFDAELLNTRFNRDVGSDYEARGWSVMGSYYIVPNRWQALARYETYDPSNIAGSDQTNMRTLGLNYLIKGDDLKLSLNYLIGNPPGSTGHQDRLIARIQVIY